MSAPINLPRSELTQAILPALRKHALDNTSILPPFRLPDVARRIVDGLHHYASSSDAQAARELGRQLSRMGLAQSSFIGAQRAAAQVLCAPELTQDDLIARALFMADFWAAVVTGLREGELEVLMRQRDDLERAFREITEKQQQELQRMIQELSTPVVPLSDRILLLPLVGRIDAERSERITERLLAAVVAHRAEVVIADVTGVSGINADIAARLFGTARSVGLLGAKMILVGIGPEVARTLVDLGVESSEVQTLANLQRGLEVARAALASRRRFGHKGPRSMGARAR